MPTLLPVAASLSAVTQTLARVDAVAEYSVPYTDMQAAFITQTAVRWSECVERSDVEGLIDLIRRHDVVAYRHLDEETRADLRRLAYLHPALRSELQDGAAFIERAIGVALPLRIQVYGEYRPEHLLHKGIALFLNMPGEVFDATLPLGSPQILQVGGWNEDVTPPSRRRLRDSLAQRRHSPHSPMIRGHFAENAIKTLAAHELAGDRVFPLLSPSRVFLGPGLTRIGRFTFLGLPEGLADIDMETEKGLDAVLRFKDQVDVLVFGAAAATQPAVMEEFATLLRPRITLAGGAESSSFRTTDHMTVLLAPGSSAVLELDTIDETLNMASEGSLSSVSWERSDRMLEILRGARAEATRNVFGNILGDRKTWRRSQGTFNGATRQALHYLILLDASPHLHGTLSEREEALLKVIGKMTEDLPLPGAASDHVDAFKELLLQSGLLERRDGL